MKNSKDTELAAALFFLLGEMLPHDPGLEDEARRLKNQAESEKDALLKVVGLCGEPVGPGSLYICTRAYSRLGENYRRQTAACAKAYLASPGWDALPGGERMENGIRVDLENRYRAVIFTDLADALGGLGLFEQALPNYTAAFELEPYCADYAVKAAGALARLGRTGEARDFLSLQKHSAYYRPVKYRDELGKTGVNDSFRRMIDFGVQKLQKAGPAKNKKREFPWNME